MDSGPLFDSASVAAKTRHFEEWFAIWVFALWTQNCTAFTYKFTEGIGSRSTLQGAAPKPVTMTYCIQYLVVFNATLWRTPQNSEIFPHEGGIYNSTQSR
jgi:hypothetical protein